MTAVSKNPFTWVEIYVDDLPRAQKFYETVFQINLVQLPNPEGTSDNSFQMLSFPWSDDGTNISGALVKSADNQPGIGGTLVYFACEDCAVEVSRVEAAGGKVLQPKMSIGNYGFCSVVLDTEGNSIGLHSVK